VKTFAKAAADYLVLRRSVGFRFERHEIHLREFVAFLKERDARWITTQLAQQFATCHTDHGSKTQAGRLSVARGFATYMLGVDPRTEVPPFGLLPARRVRARPYIYTAAEVRRVLTAARECDSVYHPLRPWNLYCILGLLAVTGMRISEVINLRPEDIDWERQVLTVRKTKFGKTRLVPVHPSTMKILSAFAVKREREVARRERKNRRKAFYFFFSKRGQRYDGSYIWRVFCELSREVGLRAPGARHGPRLHDFRHRFAVETLVRCYRSGASVEHGLSLLSTYLGHTQVTHTYWYLSCSPRLMAAASDRLELRWKEVP
jgi:integrase/recombinase XerD